MNHRVHQPCRSLACLGLLSRSTSGCADYRAPSRISRLKKSELSDAKIKGIWARIWAIEREWKKAAKWDNIRFIQRVNKAELQIKDVEISVLRERVVAFALEADARDTEIAAKEARLQIRGVGLGQKTSTPIKLRALSSKNIGPSHS